MSRRVPKLLWGLLLLAVLTAAVLLCMFCSRFWPYTLRIPSPGGDYCLEQRYTDFLAVGYRGKTFLVCGEHRWLIAEIGPGGARWISDQEFALSWGGREEIYGVSQFGTG